MNDLTAEQVDIAPGSWQTRAACRGLGDLFFSANPIDRQVAAQVCQSCAVRAECADVAESIGGYCVGTWGGVWHG